MGNCFKKNQKLHSLTGLRKSSKKLTLAAFIINLKDNVRERFTKIQDDYIISGKTLGEGSFGEVRKATHRKLKQNRAIKIINKICQSKEDQQQLLNEVNLLKKIDHPNILKIYEYYQDKNHYFIVTELCQGGELFDYIQENGVINENIAKNIFKQILSAVNYCHAHNIVHRDLKPENILLSNTNDLNSLKVIDFGVSMHMQDKLIQQKIGSIFYMAPEVIENKPYNEKCDLWSCGVIFYIILLRSAPFHRETTSLTEIEIINGNFNKQLPQYNDLSNNAKDLIEKLLEVDPEKRLSAQEALNHAFFQFQMRASKIETFGKIKQVFANLHYYRSISNIQQIIYGTMVDLLISQELKNEFMDVFKEFDVDNNGQISLQEIKEIYQNYFNDEFDQQLYEQIISKLDKDKNNQIGYSEFLIAAVDRNKILTDENIENIFILMDQQNNNIITHMEFKNFFKNSLITKNLWQRMLAPLDIQDKDYVSKQQFIKILKDMLVNQQDQIDYQSRLERYKSF